MNLIVVLGNAWNFNDFKDRPINNYYSKNVG